MDLRHAVRTELTALLGRGRGKQLAAIAGGWGLLLGTRMIYPVLLPALRESFDLSLTIAGLLVTILWLGSALGQLPGGILADRYSERLVMTAGVLVVVIALALVVTASSALVLFLATGFVGVGQSLYPIARITILADIYPGRIGSALGVTMATGDLGQTVLPPVAGMVATALAWQAGLGFVIPVLVVVAASLWVVLPVQSQPDASRVPLEMETVHAVVEEFRRSNLAFVSLILFLYILIWQSFTGFFPTYLVEEKGVSPSMAGLLFSTFFAVGVIVKPFAGAAYDRVGMRRALVVVLIGPVAGFVLLPYVNSYWQLAGVTVLVSTMLGSGAITQSFLSDAFSADLRGTGLGAVRTLVATLGAGGPVLFGAVADRGYFDEGYLLLAGILVIVILLTLRIPDDRSPASSIE